MKLDNEKLAKLLKTAFALTLLMAVFSTGMTAATIANSDAEISIWKPILQGVLIMGPIVAAEWFGYRHFKKKADVIREQREKEEKARQKAERKALMAEKRAKNQGNKKNKKKK